MDGSSDVGRTTPDQCGVLVDGSVAWIRRNEDGGSHGPPPSRPRWSWFRSRRRQFSSASSSSPKSIAPISTTVGVGSGGWGAKVVRRSSVQLASFTTLPT